MSYLVLARKWRPRYFSEVAGQEHVLRALINALDSDRLHHAFLFSGTRGVGKTTLARIFAKSINCEQGVSSTPCGQCSACREVDEGRFVDLIEVDAASRTRVDDTRELLDNVQYAPTRGRYKVYLIDEVHMLSTHSFNALLKTLEEPPPHVKFLLATTDPQKLPVTVLSRCLQFNLKRLPPAVIQEQLVRIGDAEGYDYEPAALHLLAVAADGSMRDALSLLDQAVAHAGGQLAREAVARMLGTVDRSHVARMIEALAAGDGPALMEVVSELTARGLDPDGVLCELAAMLQQIALAQVVPEALEERVDDAPAVAALAARLDAELVQLWYQIALTGRRDLPLAPSPETGLEMAVLRMLAFREDDGSGETQDGGAGGDAGVAGPSPADALRARLASVTQGGRSAGSAAPASGGAPTPANAAVPPSPAPAPAPAPVPPVDAGADTGASTGPDSVLVNGPGADPVTASVTAPGADPVAAPDSAPVTAPVAGAEPAPESSSRSPAPAPSGGAIDWDALLATLGAAGMLRQLAENCVVEAVEGRTVRLQLDHAREHLLTPQQRRALENAVQAFCGDDWRISVTVGEPATETPARRAARERDDRQREALASLRADPHVQALQSILDAKLIEESLRLPDDAAATDPQCASQPAATEPPHAKREEAVPDPRPGAEEAARGAEKQTAARAGSPVLVAVAGNGRSDADRAGLR